MMANILIRQQQPILRSSGINIHRTTSPSKNAEDTGVPMIHSVDERLFVCKRDSTRLLNLLNRFSSEPQISIYSSPVTSVHGSLRKNKDFCTLSNCSMKKDVDEIDFEELFLWNCDKTSSKTSTEETTIDSVNLSNAISTLSIKSEVEHAPEPTNIEDVNRNNHINEDDERPFRRRKRRSSLTKTSPTVTETSNESETDSNSMFTDKNSTMNDTNNEATKEEEEESNENEPVKTNRFRVRRLRHRLHHSTEVCNPLSDQTQSVLFELEDQSNRVSNEELSTPLRQPSTPVLTSETTPSGGLKRAHSSSASKKNVRFADTVGLELTQVQYINVNLNQEESKEFSMMLGSSLLSSSPPSFSKNSLYLPCQFNLEHKPWSFDVDLPYKQNLIEKPSPRRFFCLFRQPSTEPADIYLHEIWKYQIKLDRAEIPLHQSATGEQYLIGTVWVTNISFLKCVHIKYTFNRWLNTYEHEAQHRRHSNDFRNIDQFEFHIDIPSDVDRIDFVLRYSVDGHEYWDNNDGKNYTLQTENNYAPQTKISLPHDCDFNEMRFY